MNKLKPALFIGRFQPFHNGHYFSVKRLLSNYDKVIVGIGSAEKSHTMENPFTFSERKKMILACFSKNNQAKLIVIAIPDIHNDSKWVSHVISRTPKFSVVYSNNAWVRKLFREKKIPVGRTQWHDRKNCMAKRIRKRIANGKDWANVPKPVVKVLEKIKGIKRIRTLYQTN